MDYIEYSSNAEARAIASSLKILTVYDSFDDIVLSLTKRLQTIFDKIDKEFESPDGYYKKLDDIIYYQSGVVSYFNVFLFLINGNLNQDQ